MVPLKLRIFRNKEGSETQQNSINLAIPSQFRLDTPVLTSILKREEEDSFSQIGKRAGKKRCRKLVTAQFLTIQIK